jgi:hypothetical protein
LNDVLEDITTLHSGTAAPSTTYANQWWYETDTDKLYIRNEDNDAWIEILTLDQANDHLATIGATFTLDGSGNAQLDGNLTFGSVNRYIGNPSGTITKIGADNSSGEIQLSTNGTTAVTIDSSQNVGIGTSSPDSGTPLHVEESSASLGANSAASAFLVERAGNVGMTLGTANTGTCSIFMGDSDSLTRGRVQYDNNDDSLGFWANSLERVRVQSGGGISFNGDTAAANALDDYEEGTFVPTVTCSSGSVTMSATDDAAYTKIGRQVTVTARLDVSSVSSPSGNLFIGNLPFAIANFAGLAGQSVQYCFITIGSGGTGNPIAAEFVESSSEAVLRTEAWSGAASVLTTNSRIQFSWTYFTT